MAEYIERSEALGKCGWYNTVNGKSVCAVRKDELATIPTIDAVPVVRCGECERRDKLSDLTDTVYCHWYLETMYKTDFCSYGKRKEGKR